MSLKLVLSGLVIASGFLALASSVTPAGASFGSGPVVGTFGALAVPIKLVRGKESLGDGACSKELYQQCVSASGRNQRVAGDFAATCSNCFPGLGFEVLSNQIGLGPFMQYGGQYYSPPVCP